MLVCIQRNLIDFQSLGGILVVQVAQHIIMCSRNGTLINSEVHNNSLALQFAQLTCIALHVTQVNVDDAGFRNCLFGDFHNLLLRSTGILHSLYHNIVEVLGAVGIRIIIVQAGCHGCKTLNVFLIVQRVENQIIIQLLEQGEIGSSRIGSGKNIADFHFILIVLQ